MVTLSTDSSEVRERIADIGRALYTFEAQKATESGGRALATLARRNAPGRTGRLKRSIAISRPSAAAIAQKGPAVFVLSRIKRRRSNFAPYAHLVEGGTRRTPARRFFQRALAEGGSAVLAAMSRRMQQILENA